MATTLRPEQLIKKIENDSTVHRMSNSKQLLAEIDYLIATSQDYLSAEYQSHAAYVSGTDVYALVYAFYEESEKVTKSNVEDIIKKDCQYLHQELLKSKLKLDYFFVMPYFNYMEDEVKNSVLYEAVMSNEAYEGFKCKSGYGALKS